ncbi:MAG: DNA-binding domain-containing protein [Pseudomonadota bacterium]
MTGQSDFTAALFDPERPIPKGLSDPDGRPAGRRFDVYRNNVIVSLTDALETAFPVIRKLLGEENFKILARAFLRAHPPSSPLLMFWGDAFPEFLLGFEPVQNLGYLSDVARLEQALRESYHAADAAPIDPTVLGQMAPEDLIASTFELAPSVRLISSPWPVFSIWRFNQEPGAPKPQMAAEDILVTRPGFDPAPALLPTGGAAFVTALMKGAPLGDALSAPGVPEAFDLNAALGLLLQGSALTRIGDPK